jgi:hypothetical protein
VRSAFVVHHIPGRIRFLVQGATDDRLLLGRLELLLGSIHHVHRVEVNELTGSIAIEYERARFSEVIKRASESTERFEQIRLAGTGRAGRRAQPV